MTRVADAKRLTKHVRSLHPELAWVGRHLIQIPINHVHKAIFFYGGSNKDLFDFKWSVNFVFAPYPPLFNEAGRFYPDHGGLWDTADPELHLRFTEAVERQGLPLFHSLQTFDDVCRLTHDERFCWHPIDDWGPGLVAIHAANGDLDRARAAADDVVSGRNRWTHNIHHKKALDEIVNHLCPLVYAEDREGIARYLHEREREIITSWKLDKVWAPTPFPIEEQAIAR